MGHMQRALPELREVVEVTGGPCVREKQKFLSASALAPAPYRLLSSPRFSKYKMINYLMYYTMYDLSTDAASIV